jgi:hypothetical protein
MLVRKAMLLKRKLNEPSDDITGIINPNTWQLTGMSLYLSLLQEISAAMDRLCQVALNQKFLGKFRKWCKFWSHIKAKSHKKKVY